jgi:hypothetical protein
LFPSSGILSSARNGNLEVPVYFLKAKQGDTAIKMDEINGCSISTLPMTV